MTQEKYWFDGPFYFREVALHTPTLPCALAPRPLRDKGTLEAQQRDWGEGGTLDAKQREFRIGCTHFTLSPALSRQGRESTCHFDHYCPLSTSKLVREEKT
jgi:hypothetical protein